MILCTFKLARPSLINATPPPPGHAYTLRIYIHVCAKSRARREDAWVLIASMAVSGFVGLLKLLNDYRMNL